MESTWMGMCLTVYIDRLCLSEISDPIRSKINTVVSYSSRSNMLTDTELYFGGLAATVVSALGSIFNICTLYVLLGTKSIRSNPTTVLIIFLTISNLVYTGLVLPQTAASMLHIR